MPNSRQELELMVDEMSRATATLMEQIIKTGDKLADDQLKLALLEDSNRPDYQDLRVLYVRRLVRNRRKLEDLNNKLEHQQEQLAKAKEQLRNAPTGVLAAQ
ncbi:MAG TPA: hypothetical protein DDZ53_04285 [Firmicutes bacterium]|nr:hypothetical protein [Bacillota bacterium]